MKTIIVHWYVVRMSIGVFDCHSSLRDDLQSFGVQRFGGIVSHSGDQSDASRKLQVIGAELSVQGDRALIVKEYNGIWFLSTDKSSSSLRRCKDGQGVGSSWESWQQIIDTSEKLITDWE
jgi:hypothetical protein